MGLWTSSIVGQVNIKNIKKVKSHRFGSWLGFRPQVNGGGEEKNIYSVGPLRQN
jgi:hypothetical protein